MAPKLRNTGISVVGDVPWGTHFCSFYETKQDLLDILIPFFKTGLEHHEFCLWTVSNSELLTMQEARNALQEVLPDLDRYVAERSIEVVGHEDWFLSGKTFDPHTVANQFRNKLNDALARGYAGMRVNGSPAWLHDAAPQELRKFEAELDRLFPNEHTIASCTYPLAKIGADEIFDVTRTHRFAIARRRGEWEVLETPELIQAKQEIRRLNEELEQRVIERTKELAAANDELRKEIAGRKRAEALLHAKEQEFRAIVENAPDQIIRCDRDFRRVYVNPAVAKAYGLSAEALTSKPMGSVIQDAGVDVNEDELAQLRQRIEAVFETGKSCEFEIAWPLPTGRKSFSIRVFPELDVDGSVFNVIGIARDITERKQVEDALRRNEDHLRLIIDTIPMMAWSLGSDAVLDFVNQRWLDYTGLSFEEAIEEETRTVHPEDLSRVMKKWLAVKDTSEAYEDEMRLRRADGEYRWFLIRIAPLVDEQGNLLKRYGVAIDIEERKLAEENLKHSEVQLAEAQRLAHIGSWDWDLRTNAVTWSEELYHIFGLQPGTISVAGEVDRFIHPDDLALGWDTVKRAIASKEPYDYYHRILRPDGTERIARSHGAIMSDERGEPIKVFGATQDVTELKRAEVKLRATTEQLRALSASVQSAREEESKRIAREIHDELGGALTSWKWDLEEIRDEMSRPLDASQAATVRHKIEGMIKLTETTLDTVRRLASELRPAALELGLVQGLEWQTLQFENRTGIPVQLECDVEKVDLDNGQATAVFRILQEALTNIQRHAHATHVTITCGEESPQFVLTIKDNGRGMTNSEESATQSLGLLGMRERANLVGGEIAIESAAGEGTKITVRVPMSASQRSGTLDQ